MAIFNATGTGETGTVQQWIAPKTANYQITAVGAMGGGEAGGRGARITGYFLLTVGDTIDIAVGQKGNPIGAGNGTGNNNGSGGGASFVKDAAGNPLIVAGGGAGNMDGTHPGCHGQAGTSAGTTTTTRRDIEATSGSSWSTGGNGNAQPLNGTALGCTLNSYNVGGFGGGGSTTDGGSYSRVAGGGGYEGGEGAYFENAQGGGGGGSFNAGTDQTNLAGSYEDSDEDGWVSIYETVTVEGVIYDATGSPASRTVRIYDRSDGSLYAEVLSDAATGHYSAKVSTELPEIQRIVLADEAVLSNDIIDRINTA